MSEENPYSSPSTDPILEQPIAGQLQLATPGERFLGALVDGLINVAIVFPISFGIGFLGIFKGSLGEADFGFTAAVVVVSFAIFVAIQWTFLSATGQTIGKKVAKTRIVTMDGRKPVIGDLIFKRYLFMNLIGIIPIVGRILALVDALLVFKADRRCLHDLIAGTQVVKIRPGETIS